MIKDQGSGINDHGSRIQDQGSRTKDQRSSTKDVNVTVNVNCRGVWQCDSRNLLHPRPVQALAVACAVRRGRGLWDGGWLKVNLTFKPLAKPHPVFDV